MGKVVEKESADNGSASSENKKLDEQLDKALEQTFPASDPVAVGQETVKPEGRESRKAAPVNVDLAKKLAEKLEAERNAE